MTSQLTVDALLEQMGVTGRRLDHLHAAEAGAGNISISVDWDTDLESVFPEKKPASSSPGRYLLWRDERCS